MRAARRIAGRRACRRACRRAAEASMSARSCRSPMCWSCAESPRRARASRRSRLPTAFPLVEDNGELGIDADDFAVISDCRQAALFRVNRIERGDGVATLVRAAGGGPFDNAAGVSLSATDTPYGGALDSEGAAVFGVVTEIYFVARGTGRNNGRIGPGLPMAKDDDGRASGIDPGSRGCASAPGSGRERRRCGGPVRHSGRGRRTSRAIH